jgi:tRNA pseudouridine38-40 synthase
VQANAATVQAEVERALGVMLKGSARVRAAGRTDAGVHALAQVVNFTTGATIPLKAFLHGLNTLLPRDIAVRRADEVPLDFDSRRDAREKTYQYFLHRGAAPSAFARRTSWRVTGSIDPARLERAAIHLVGIHDYGAFRSAGCEAAHAVREIRAVWVKPRGDYLEVGVRGTAFLRHMVRIIVGTLVEVGQGKREPDSVRALLESRDRGLAGPTAPPQGLFLAEVRYDVQPLETCP